MNTDDIPVVDNISADSIVIGDQIVVEGDHIEIHRMPETDDIDEIVVIGYSHDTGDRVQYSLYADDYYDVWSL